MGPLPSEFAKCINYLHWSLIDLELWATDFRNYNCGSCGKSEEFEACRQQQAATDVQS